MPEYYTAGGTTQGTFYNISYGGKEIIQLKQSIDSLLQDLPKAFLVKVVEKPCYVCVYQPLDAVPHTQVSEFLQCLVSTVSFSETVGEVVEVLLIHRSQ